MPPNSNAHVQEQLKAGNPWYVGSQFEWAAEPHMVLLFKKRLRFIRGCVERARTDKKDVLRILEVGCGDGYWLYQLSNLPGISLTGIDYNPVRVERARQVAPIARVECGDLLTYRSALSFDLVLFSQVLEHVEDDNAALKWIRQLLAPGGMLVLGVPNEGCWLQKQSRCRQNLQETDHIHFYTEKIIAAKLAANGYHITRVMREPFYFFSERWTYCLMRTRTGFAFLELLATILPGGCTDFYLECERG